MATKKKAKKKAAKKPLARRVVKGSVRKTRPRAKKVTGAYFPSGEITSADLASAPDRLQDAPMPTFEPPRAFVSPEEAMRMLRRESEPHVASEPSTHEEILASDNRVIRENYLAAPRPPERHTYTPPTPGPVPQLPSLVGRSLEFHTTRHGMYCDVAFALLPEDGIAIKRVTDRHGRDNPAVNYQLAGADDLDDVQSGEVASHYWHHATDEQHAAIEKCVSLDESIAHWRSLATQEAQDAGDPAAQHRAKLYERAAESLKLEQSTGRPHCVDHLEPLPCKLHEEARR